MDIWDWKILGLYLQALRIPCACLFFKFGWSKLVVWRSKFFVVGGLGEPGCRHIGFAMVNKSAHNIHVSFTLWIFLLTLAHLTRWCEYISTHHTSQVRPSLLFSDHNDPAAAIVVGLGHIRQAPPSIAFNPRKVATVLPSRRNVLLLALLRAGDVETNPGPRQADIFSCGFCQDHVSWSQQAICCDGCNIWFHRSCQSMSESHYHVIGNTDTQWKCCRCNSQLSNTFHSYELYDTNVNVDSKLAGTSPHMERHLGPVTHKGQEWARKNQVCHHWSSALRRTAHRRAPCQQQTTSLHNVPPSQSAHYVSAVPTCLQTSQLTPYQLRVGTGGHSYWMPTAWQEWRNAPISPIWWNMPS